MKQLSPMDSAFLGLENDTMTGNIASVMILEPGPDGQPLDMAQMKALAGSRLDKVPVFRKRLHTVPLGVGRPYWVDDRRFDIDYHIRESAVPKPGSTKLLLDLVGRLHERPLDMSRPLWEMYVISGLKGGRVAIYTKTHHVMIDGVAGVELLAALVSPKPWEPGEIKTFHPERSPWGAELLARTALGVWRRPADAFEIVKDLTKWTPALINLGATLSRPVREDAGPQPTAGDALPVRTPMTTFNRQISRARRVGITDLPLADIKEVKNAFNASVNDVVMAATAGALRRWLQEHEHVPRVPLVAMVPVAVKSDRSDLGNYVTAMLATLPTHLDDPVKRLARCRRFSRSAKKKGGAIPPDLLVSAMEFAPPVFLGLGARAVWDGGLFRAFRPFNVVVSNVPGGAADVYVGHSRVEAIYPVSVVTDGLGLNITLMGHKGNLHLGITSCPDLVPNPQELTDWMREELDILLEHARQKQPPEQAAAAT